MWVMEMNSRYMKRYSTSLIIMKMQTKITMRYHLKLVRRSIIEKVRDNKY